MTLPTDRRIREIGRGIARQLVEGVGSGAGRQLVIAVSGGADSSALLLTLTDTQSRHGWRVRAAHVDHLIQAESVRAGFRSAARDLAATAGVPYHLIAADAAAEAAESSDGLEAAARRVRYRSLTELALELGAPAVTVAHTQDDQAETVLLHILRGSGLDGLSGMPRVRPLNDPLNDEVALVRPMLDLTRADAEAVCTAYGWTPAHDPSNDDPAHTRNRVRRSILPAMREINPNISERLAELARAVGPDRELLNLIGRQTLKQALDDDGRLPRRVFLSLPGQLQVRVIRALALAQGAALSSERTASALQVIHNGHGVVELPQGVRLRVARGAVQIEASSPPDTPAG